MGHRDAVSIEPLRPGLTGSAVTVELDLPLGSSGLPVTGSPDSPPSKLCSRRHHSTVPIQVKWGYPLPMEEQQVTKSIHSRRDDFAGLAMQTILADSLRKHEGEFHNLDLDDVAAKAWYMASAMERFRYHAQDACKNAERERSELPSLSNLT
jgi:hypothetical protein